MRCEPVSFFWFVCCIPHTYRFYIIHHRMYSSKNDILGLTAIGMLQIFTRYSITGDGLTALEH